VACDSNAFAPGEQVLVTGYYLGINTAGGFGRYIRIPSSWALKLPDGMTLRIGQPIQERQTNQCRKNMT
jgi:NADPH:quinone reductase-like Zn-dependent oxidoreductase